VTCWPEVDFFANGSDLSSSFLSNDQEIKNSGYYIVIKLVNKIMKNK